LLKQATAAFFGPLRVSVLLDANGANTTAAAAVLAAAKHIELRGAAATVLGGTGPVGQRVVRLLAKQGANIRVCSRLVERAQDVCQAVAPKMTDAQLTPLQCASMADAV